MSEEDPLAQAKRDWTLETRVVNALTERNMPSLRRVKVTARGGTVTLSGSVHSFYEKQLSHHCVRLVSGVTWLIDRIEVTPAPTFQDPQTINRAAIGGIGLLLVAAIVALSAASIHGRPSRLAVFPAKGRVLFNGRAVPGATVVFHPKGSPDAPHPRATVDKQGNFILTTYERGDGAPRGEYLVTVEWQQLTMQGGDAHYVNALPAEYMSVRSTKLQTTVWEETENRVQLSLSGRALPVAHQQDRRQGKEVTPNGSRPANCETE